MSTAIASVTRKVKGNEPRMSAREPTNASPDACYMAGTSIYLQHRITIRAKALNKPWQ